MYLRICRRVQVRADVDQVIPSLTRSVVPLMKRATSVANVTR
jgi:hypothetical protein